MKENKIHHCFNCGEETDSYETLPNGKDVWICESNECYKELRNTAREIDYEARREAEDDNYSRYY